MSVRKSVSPESPGRRSLHHHRHGGVSPQFLVGAVLWTAVGGWVIWILMNPGETDSDATGEQQEVLVSGTQPESGRNNPTVSSVRAVAKRDDQSTVKIRFPARELPDFEFPECQGGTVSRDGLKGRPWVASFVFTRCITTCPTITLAMKKLQDRIGDKNKDVQFVTFSVDSSHDTAEVLRQYAEVYSADPERWKFVTGDELEIHDLIRRGFTQYVKPNLGEERKPGFEVAHTNRVVLVNEDSIPVATFLATRDTDMVALRRILEGKTEFPEPGPPADDENPQVIVPEFELRKQPEQSDENDKAGGADGESTGSDQSNGTKQDSEANADPAADGAEDSVSTGDRTASKFIPSASGRYQFTSYLPQSKADKTAAPSEESVNEIIDSRLPGWAMRLPSVNAGLNSLSILLLVSGYASIRAGHKLRHRNFMIAAFVASAAFLGCYLAYHWALGEYTGQHGRAFIGPDWGRITYYLILIPHVILAALVPFLSIRVFWLAFAGRWESHKRLARVTFPIWMFVSVTGVIIYVMLYHWPSMSPAAAA
jgi:protein SCO1/2